MDRYDGADPINLGGGADVSIRELAEALQAIIGFTGSLRFATDKPDGMPLKRLDSTPLQTLGWRPRTPFPRALQATYAWFVQHDRQPLAV